jgi:two-component system phosphate regulon sensor histidine kinase PhoR
VFSYHLGSPQRVRVVAIDSAGRDRLLLDSLKGAGDYSMHIADSLSRGSYFYSMKTDSITLYLRVVDGAHGEILETPENPSDRAFLVSRVVENMRSTEAEPIERRLKPALLDSLLRVSMNESGIPIPFSYGVTRGGTDSIRLAQPPSATLDLRESDLRGPLFLFDALAPRTDIVVFFPGRNTYLLQQLWPVVLASVVFLGLIAFAFVATIRTIIRQRNLAAHMVDFINNMTHEFKTPIATVALASEAIARPDIVSRKGKVLQYNSMISDETVRMKNQVDRILQMAVLERGDYELAMADLDMENIVRAAVEKIRLQVEARKGTITFDPGPERRRVRGDAMHLSNIVNNLLDNANKYSTEAPDITVHTEYHGGRFVLTIADRGIGIAPEHQKLVFDKYYRVPTGNLHDVKGFGLGLSYVRLLVEAHGGTITLTSTPGKGTEVKVSLPVQPGSPLSNEEPRTTPDRQV